MNVPEESRLIFDWSKHGAREAHWPSPVMLYDETLRDGLQSPSVIDPPLETKVEILHLMEALGIDAAPCEATVACVRAGSWPSITGTTPTGGGGGGRGSSIAAAGGGGGAQVW